MNFTRIEWTDYTWNPITGCKGGCWYCYARKGCIRFNKTFEPVFHPERLLEPDKLKTHEKIFCCSISDLFADWTPVGWREAVLQTIENCPWHTFQLLTKHPEGIDKKYEFGDWVWVGTTITIQEDIWRIEELKKIKARVKFISFEPLFENINCNLKGIDWIIIGKLTGHGRFKLNPQWINNLIQEARKHNIPVFIKDNVEWPEVIREYPEVK